tara:strand:+ start:580 stop:1164 length:585 start_codon:yes stop_codon:yes gene_type:complete
MDLEAIQTIQRVLETITKHNDSEIQKSYEDEYNEFHEFRDEGHKNEIENKRNKIYLEHHNKIKDQLDENQLDEAISAVNKLDNVKKSLEEKLVARENHINDKNKPSRPKFVLREPTTAELQKFNEDYDTWYNKKEELEAESEKLQEIIGKLEPLKKIYVPETTGGKRKTRRNRKSKKSRKGKSRKNRRKSKSHR